MPHDQKQGLIIKQLLTEEELLAIQQLIVICNGYEDLHMRISSDMLRLRPGIEANDFLYYEDDMLVGYLAVDSWGIDEKELTGMMHPDYRRRGIFRALLNAAQAECGSRGVKQLVLVCEHSSRSGQAFIKAIGAEYDFAEHEMILTNFQERLTFDDRLIFRPASADDLDLVVRIKAGSFGDPEDLVRNMTIKFLQSPDRRYYVTTFGDASVGCKEPVGVLRLDEGKDEIGIYAFGILPAYRGRGYGRQMLEETIRTVRAHSQKTIMLDVDTKNANAIGLYRSCGFEIKTTYDYYKIDIHST